ncbi:MAG: hypothetical protein JZU65_18060 [Chlorobium sp.]|nr:hypothetical protein [Chlorobium sp.]
MFNVKITTPVLLMVFNRPEKTQRVFDVIKTVKPQKLYIAADAPRGHVATDIENCAKVREIVSQINWECDARFLFHDKNLGCSLAGKTAWDWFFSQEEEMIFIEDDGLVSASFFWFCQEMLEKYRNDSRIAYIGGVNYGPKYGDSSYFFSRLPAATYCMATWKRVYDLYEYKMDSYNSIKRRPDFKANFGSKFESDFLCSKFEEFVNNGGNTYDIQMIYLGYKYSMYSIVPNINLASNIGLDSGANNNLDPDSYIAIRLGNRPRYELSEINHPEKVGIDKEFEAEYFRVRVLYGESWASSKIRFYGYKYLRPFYRVLLKKPLMLLGLK